MKFDQASFDQLLEIVNMISKYGTELISYAKEVHAKLQQDAELTPEQEKQLDDSIDNVPDYWRAED